VSSLPRHPQGDHPQSFQSGYASSHGLAGGAGSRGVEYGFAGNLQPCISAGIDYAIAPLKATSSLSAITAEASFEDKVL
jgi:hypothetical protein